MTRLKQYILYEKRNVDFVWEALLKDCKPFLKELKKSMSSTGSFFYRGYNNFNGDIYGFQKKKSRMNRRPRDTPLEVHRKIDNKFYDMFGWHVRSEGIFVTSGLKFAKSYGTSTMFFPIGKYKYVWSPKIEDLYDGFGSESLENVEDALRDNYDNGGDSEYEYELEYGEDSNGGHWDGDEWIPDLDYDYWLTLKIDEVIYDFEEELEKSIKGFKRNDMKGALKSRHETIFKCSEYYLVSYQDHYENLLKLIKETKV